MNYKIIRHFIWILLLWLGVTGCPKRSELCGTVKASYTGEYKFNEIGILGTPSATPYIEVQYTIKNGSGGNQILTEWVSPPCLIGGYPINTYYDSVNMCSDGQVTGILPFIKVDYAKGSPEYMKIINHSANSVEYFIAGTQDTATILINSVGINIPSGVAPPPSKRTTIITPFVMYNNAPVYYLLHPERKPNVNLYSLMMNIHAAYIGEYRTLTSVANPAQIGNLQVSQAWSIEEVMKLYRAEYRQSPDTLLTLCFDDFTGYPAGEPINARRISTGVSTVSIVGKNNLFLRPKDMKFYGFIPANGTLESSNLNPLISHYSSNSGLTK